MTSASPRIHFLDIPPEILTQILLKLHWEDFLRLTKVCKTIRDLITNSSEIQYRICLGALGYEATLAEYKLPPIDQLERFQKLSKGFLTGQFTKKESLTLQGYTPTYELQGGAFIQGRAASNSVRDTVGVNVLKFASFLYREPTTQWQLPDFPRVVRDLTLDPSQDLLALIVDKSEGNQIVIDMEFYSLATGQPHPLAKGNLPKDIWKIENAFVLSFVITIMEDFVGLLSADQQFFICNWKTGKIHAMLDFTVEDSIHDFFFLDHSRYAVVRGDRNPPEVHIHHLPTESADPDESIVLSIYHLPKLQEDVGVRLQCRSDPPPPCRNPTVNISPIQVQAKDRILIFNFAMQTEQFLGSFLLCVRAETFMNTPPDAQKDEDDIAIVTSDLWMRKSRILPDLLGDHNWMCYVYGSRFISFAHSQADSDKRSCQIFLIDFTPNLIALASKNDQRILGEYENPDSNRSFFTKEDSKDPDAFLAETWTHALPVMRIITSIKYDVAPDKQLVVMLDQERIMTIMLKTDSFSHMREPYMLDIHHPMD